jgi:hypothetical protein
MCLKRKSRLMRMKAGLAAGLLCLLPTVVLAEGCRLEGGITVAEVEALNQMMLDLDVDRFSATIEKELGSTDAEQMRQIAEVYKDGFHGCTTIAQRVDLGGMVQNLVFFNGKTAPLFVYWMAVDDGERHVLMSFKFSTVLDDVMVALR